MKRRTSIKSSEIVGGSAVRCGRGAIVLAAIAWLGGCDVVLGIDDVSAADGPDGGRGQRLSATETEPEPDASEPGASLPDDDAGRD